MVPFNLQLELINKPTTPSAEQLGQLADLEGLMRYQIRAFNHSAVIFVNVEEEPLSPEDIVGFSENDVFTPDEVRLIAVAIRQYNSDHQLSFEQMTLDFLMLYHAPNERRNYQQAPAGYDPLGRLSPATTGHKQ